MSSANNVIDMYVTDQLSQDVKEFHHLAVLKHPLGNNYRRTPEHSDT